MNLTSMAFVVGRPQTWLVRRWLLENTKTFVRSMSSVERPVRKREKSDRGLTETFVDFKRMQVKGGHGGKGGMSFLSLPFNEWAGPDGGNGGNGGHVIFEATHNVRSLSHLRSVMAAPSGVKGRNKSCHGKNAEHLTLRVPRGTLIKDLEGRVLADLNQEGEFYIAARGGAGGKGNQFFLSNENRAPMTYEEGGLGEERNVLVELRVMAHAGLIGFPNVGKSTLLRAISRAKPKVAAYPFTTLRPHVGMVEYPDYVQIAVADIPGLIEGAHQNQGLGFQFLRHVERCRCLLYVLDLSLDNPINQLYALQYELKQYQTGLSERPHAVIGNKLDLPGAEKKLESLHSQLDLPVYGISARKVENIKPLLLHLRELYDEIENDKADISKRGQSD